MKMFNVRVVLTALFASAFAFDTIYPRSEPESGVNTAPVLERRQPPRYSDPRFASDAIYPRNEAGRDVETAPALERRQITWYTDPKFAAEHGLETERVTEVVQMSGHSHLLARAPPPTRPSSKNIFTRLCQREISGQPKPSVTHSDVFVPIDGIVQSVATPGGGQVEVTAQRYIDRADRQQKMDVSIINHSQCAVTVDWTTPLYWHNTRRNDPANAVPNVEIASTPKREWYDDPSLCYVDDLEPSLERTVIAIKLLLRSYYC